MAVSSKVRYGLTALVYIAARHNENSKGISAVEIARENDISLKYLEQIMVTLRKDGVLTALRGISGGYKLARPASEITLTEILKSLDGIACMTSAECSCTVWESINDFVCKSFDNVVTDFTDNVTLRDIASNYLNEAVTMTQGQWI